jgi:hypothetical protein
LLKIFVSGFETGMIFGLLRCSVGDLVSNADGRWIFVLCIFIHFCVDVFGLMFFKSFRCFQQRVTFCPVTKSHQKTPLYCM